MRFGSRSHDTEHDKPERVDPKPNAERDRLSRLLRDLADRIERAKPERLSEGVPVVRAAAESLVRTAEQALGLPAPKGKLAS